MDKKTALRYIDQWGNFYLRMLGEADHLELIEKDFYTILRPKDKKWASIFDIRIEHLHDDELTKTVNKIKAMNQHVWWNQYSDRINAVIFPEGRSEPNPNDDEVFAVMMPNDTPIYQNETINVREATVIEDFEIFHKICFDKTFSPDNYLSLYQKGMIRCYIGYSDDMPVSGTIILKNGQIYSLELVSTLCEYRKKGYAAAVCQRAIKDAFNENAEVVTIRAGGGPAADNSSKYLGKKLGFNYL